MLLKRIFKISIVVMNFQMKRKAFISAPLLGTLIFLAAILFVLSLSQIDRAEVSSISLNAYHQSISSNLQYFRNDLNALFSESVSRAVQNYLTSQCWNAFTLQNSYNLPTSPQQTYSTAPRGFANLNTSQVDFDNLPFCLNTPLASQTSSTFTADSNYNQCNNNPLTSQPSIVGNPNPTYSPICQENCNNELDYYELRYQQCSEVSSLLLNGICSFNSNYGIPGWFSTVLGQSGGGATCTFTDSAGKQCVSSNLNGNFTLSSSTSSNSIAGTCVSTGASCTCIDQYSQSVQACPTSPGKYLSSTGNSFSFQGQSFSIPNANLARQLTNSVGCQFTTGGNTYTINDPTMYTISSSEPTVCYGNCGSNGQCSSSSSIDLNVQSACQCIGGSCSSQSSSPTGATCSGSQGTVINSFSGQQLCTQLVGKILFDCRQFAEHTNTADCSSSSTDNNAQCPYRCCSKYAQFNPNLQGSLSNLNAYAGLCCADTKIKSLTSSEKQSLGCDASGNSQYLVAGCTQGGFAIQLNPSASSNLYQSIPRIQATDQAGNTLSTTAISSSSSIVQITYPLFKYLDASLKIYSGIAYGVGNGESDFLNPQVNMKLFSSSTQNKPSNNQGIVQGLCYGSHCSSLGKIPLNYQLLSQSSSGISVRRTFVSNGQSFNIGTNNQNAKQDVLDSSANNFVNTFLYPYLHNPTVSYNPSTTSICRLFSSKYCSDFGLCQSELWVSFDSGNSFQLLCPSSVEQTTSLPVYDKSNINSNIYKDVSNQLVANSQGRCSNTNPSNKNHCAYFDSFRLTFEIRDSSPSTLVDAPTINGTGTTNGGYNPFCFYINPQFLSPCVLNPTTGTCMSNQPI